MVVVVAIFDCRKRDAFNRSVFLNRFRKLLIECCVWNIVAESNFVDLAGTKCNSWAANEATRCINNAHGGERGCFRSNVVPNANLIEKANCRHHECGRAAVALVGFGAEQCCPIAFCAQSKCCHHPGWSTATDDDLGKGLLDNHVIHRILSFAKMLAESDSYSFCFSPT